MLRNETLAFFTTPSRVRIAVPLVDGMNSGALAAAKLAGMDVAELRIDLYKDTAPGKVVEEAKKIMGFPSIATIRSSFEGGKWDGTEPARLELYKLVLPLVSMVDVELSSPEIRQQLIEAAHEADRTVIVSFHDFTGTPPFGTLEGVVQRAWEAGADIVKIAAQVNSVLDLQNLARVLVTHPQIPMIVIGMGDQGKISRVAFPALGSVLTFASLDTATAPGQMELAEMRAVLA